MDDPATLAPGLLFWRSFTHWLGGMGIVVLTVAILPFLGAGGYQLLRAEAPGPTADKLQPRIAETAKILWIVYVLLTVLEIVALLPSMSLYDASCHAFGTLATAGFSTKALSVAHFNSIYVEAVIIFFMIIAGLNFVLHYRLLVLGRGFEYFRDAESRFFLGVIVIGTIFMTVLLFSSNYPDLTENPDKYGSFGSCFRYAAFQVVAIVTTTGFVTADFDGWPNACRCFFVVLMIMGGCAGSTAGGAKCIRFMVLIKYGLRELHRLIRPHAVLSLRIGGHSIDREVVARVMGFLALWIIIFAIAVLFMALILEPPATPAPTQDQENTTFITAFSSVLSTLGNIGPGFGSVGPTKDYSAIPTVGKVLLIFLMLLGRLEIYAVLIVFIPLTWRR